MRQRTAAAMEALLVAELHSVDQDEIEECYNAMLGFLRLCTMKRGSSRRVARDEHTLTPICCARVHMHVYVLCVHACVHRKAHRFVV